ncbi:Twin-arginine translocation pathway signal, partial [human gut metagenome]
LKVKDADEVIIKIVVHTSFNGYKNEAGTQGKDVNDLCENSIQKIRDKTYVNLYNAHKIEYKSLFDRLQFTLNSDFTD